ncbi:hypothetical protein [Pseudoalteromonas neustonica]|uniref:hypothetical protein n=1 Tax=Pseudoalteromonas neustonica TaxID=1840331 RepID=UPI003CCC4F68
MQSIQLQNITARLGAEERDGYLLKGISWQVNSGEHWVLLGGNDAGKSAITATLLFY